MEFEALIDLVKDEPVFNTGFLLAGDVSPGYIRRQLSGWVSDGKLWQFRRGLYALAPPYQKVKPHPFLVANRMLPGSYVSLQSALSHVGLIPEYVPVTTSVTGRRPAEWHTPVGSMLFRQIQPGLIYGAQRVEITRDQHCYLATPEKALLDLIYLQPGGDSPAYIRSLRLGQVEQLDLSLLTEFTRRADKPKLQRAVDSIQQVVVDLIEEYEAL